MNKSGTNDYDIMNDICNIDKTYAPLVTFIIITTICVMIIIGYSIRNVQIPSITFSLLFVCVMILSCSILALIGRVSVKLEWVSAILLIFIIMMSSYTCLYPNLVIDFV